MPVIGCLDAATRQSRSVADGGVPRGLSEIGYVDGQNVAIEYRFAEGADRLPALAAELSAVS